MRKHLANTQEVFHYWANAVQESGECGNVSFRGPKAFSYARCIAMKHEYDGRYLVLFGTHGYDSATTAKHQSYARQAAAHFRKIEVPIYEPTDASEHLTNLQALMRDYSECVEKAKKARTQKEFWNARAFQLTKDFDAYCVFFERPERFNEDTAKELQRQVEAERETRIAQEKARQEKADAALAEKLAEWRKGEDVDIWGLSFIALRLAKSQGTYHTGGLLPDRGSEGKQVVETSRGANIPVEDAKRLWRLIRVVRGSGHGHVDPDLRLGVYRLSQIRTDGSIVVGCHDIPYSEIEGIAKALGLIEVAA